MLAVRSECGIVFLDDREQPAFPLDLRAPLRCSSSVMAFAALDNVELVKRRWRTKLKAVLDAACFLPEDPSAPVRKVGIMDKAKPVDLSSPVTFDTTLPEYVADPYPILRRIQETEPLRKTTMGWLVTRYDDAANLLRESRIWGSGMTPERRLAVFGAGPMSSTPLAG